MRVLFFKCYHVLHWLYQIQHVLFTLFIVVVCAGDCRKYLWGHLGHDQTRSIVWHQCAAGLKTFEDFQSHQVSSSQETKTNKKKDMKKDIKGSKKVDLSVSNRTLQQRVFFFIQAQLWKIKFSVIQMWINSVGMKKTNFNVLVWLLFMSESPVMVVFCKNKSGSVVLSVPKLKY